VVRGDVVRVPRGDQLVVDGAEIAPLEGHGSSEVEAALGSMVCSTSAANLTSPRQHYSRGGGKWTRRMS
jgi:hypothetical protein